MELDRIIHQSCIADIGVGDDFATIYFIKSEEKQKGYATELLKFAQMWYESQGKTFGSSVALNPVMSGMLEKLKIKQYK